MAVEKLLFASDAESKTCFVYLAPRKFQPLVIRYLAGTMNTNTYTQYANKEYPTRRPIHSEPDRSHSLSPVPDNDQRFAHHDHMRIMCNAFCVREWYRQHCL